MVGVGVLGGHVVDDYFQLNWPIFTIIFGIMGVFIASFIYNMYKETSNDSEEGE